MQPIPDRNSQADSGKREKEKDLSICYNYEKTGTCPKEDFCPLLHLSTPMSRCLVFHHLYPNPEYFASFLDEKDLQLDQDAKLDSFDAFYLDIYLEMKLFGKVEDLVVAGNLSTHLYGNVYVRYTEVDSAVAAHKALEGRFYAGRIVHSSFMPVEKLSTAICKEENCLHGSACTRVHPIIPSKHVTLQMFSRQMKAIPTELRKYNNDDLIPDSPYEILQGRSKYLQKRKFSFT